MPLTNGSFLLASLIITSEKLQDIKTISYFVHVLMTFPRHPILPAAFTRLHQVLLPARNYALSPSPYKPLPEPSIAPQGRLPLHPAFFVRQNQAKPMSIFCILVPTIEACKDQVEANVRHREPGADFEQGALY